MRKKVITFMTSILIMVIFFETIISMGLFGNNQMITAYAGGNPYPVNNVYSTGEWSNCTWSAWQLVKNNLGIELPAWGNGKQWYGNAKNSGYQVGSTPQVNSIVVYSDSGYGHVAFVTGVSSDGKQIYIKEGGWNKNGDIRNLGYHEGWTNAYGKRQYNESQSILGYIYLKQDLPFVKCIDGPSNNATYTNEYVTVFGWAVNKDNVSLITCTVNDQTYISDQFYAKDIADLFSGKGYPTDKGRFECKIPFWAFVDGSNTITVRFWCGQTELGSETRTVVYNNKGTQSISDGQYYIKSALDNNYVLDLKDGGTANGTNIILNKYSGSDSQKFYVKYVGDGYYELISEKSGKCVDVAGGNKAPGTNVQTWDYYGVKSQKYIIRQADNGTYYLVSGTGGAYVDVYGAKIASGTNIQIWSGNNNNAQKWKFEAVKQTPASDGWYYSYGLPSNITSDKYDIQYQNTYAKNQAASPGSGWVNSGVYSTEYVKDGGSVRISICINYIRYSQTCIKVLLSLLQCRLRN